MRKSLWVCLLLVVAASFPAEGLATRSLKDGLTPEELVRKLTGPGAVIGNVRITGSAASFGTFEGAAFGAPSGVVLSSGDVADSIGPNNSSGAGSDVGASGDASLDAIVAPNVTHDAAVIEFDVITTTPLFTISYVFGSEEYTEYVGKPFNDVFAFFVDGSNIARLPGSDEPVAINNINHLRNSHLYIDRTGSSATQLDGTTVPLVAIAFVEPGVSHHIKIAIADTADGRLDSAVFIEQGGMAGASAPVVIPPVSSLVVESGDTVDLTLPVYFVFDEVPHTLEAFGLPGLESTFSEPRIVDGAMYVDMKLKIPTDIAGGEYTLTIRSAIAGAERLTTLPLTVNCRPPVIAGIGQPQTQSVSRGSSATLTVAPGGTGSFSYQWYRGFAGMTRSPVEGATDATLVIPSVTEHGLYWVRVTNACGTFDSIPAHVVPR